MLYAQTGPLPPRGAPRAEPRPADLLERPSSGLPPLSAGRWRAPVTSQEAGPMRLPGAGGAIGAGLAWDP